jgi:hypothetical protein
MLVGCVYFDWHPGSPFFSHRKRMLLSRLCVCVLSFRHHSLSLSPQKLGHSCFDNNTRSLSLLRKSLARSVCSDVPASMSRSPPPTARALRIARRRKGPEQTSTALSSAPPILLLSHAQLVESPRQGGN